MSMEQKIMAYIWVICVVFVWLMIVVLLSIPTMITSPPGEVTFVEVIIQNLLSVTNIIVALIVGSIMALCFLCKEKYLL